MPKKSRIQVWLDQRHKEYHQRLLLTAFWICLLLCWLHSQPVCGSCSWQLQAHGKREQALPRPPVGHAPLCSSQILHSDWPGLGHRPTSGVRHGDRTSWSAWTLNGQWGMIPQKKIEVLFSGSEWVSTTKILLPSLFYRWGHWCSEKISGLSRSHSEVTERELHPGTAQSPVLFL